MILKAGTYKFNDELSEAEFNQDIDFTLGGIADGISFSVYCSNMKGGVKSFLDGTSSWVLSIFEDKLIEDGEENVLGIEVDVYKGTAGWVTSPAEGFVHTITEDTEVDDTFGAWYIDSTNYNEVINPPLAEITYNGETIAKINAGETVILKCEGLPMETDIIVKVNG